MYYLLELREKMKKVYASYNVYIRPAVKFLLALLSFILLNARRCVHGKAVSRYFPASVGVCYVKAQQSILINSVVYFMCIFAWTAYDSGAFIVYDGSFVCNICGIGIDSTVCAGGYVPSLFKICT